jgi:hypothetical protein
LLALVSLFIGLSDRAAMATGFSRRLRIPVVGVCIWTGGVSIRVQIAASSNIHEVSALYLPHVRNRVAISSDPELAELHVLSILIGEKSPPPLLSTVSSNFPSSSTFSINAIITCAASWPYVDDPRYDDLGLLSSDRLLCDVLHVIDPESQ